MISGLVNLIPERSFHKSIKPLSMKRPRQTAIQPLPPKMMEVALNWRSLQSICDIADEVHKGAYQATKSAVVDIPPVFTHHHGAFIVKQSEVTDYITAYDPMVLRWNVASGKQYIPAHARCYNFGASKGLGFDRALVVPTDSQMHFVLDGNTPFPIKAETAQNKLYVAITRARYSLAFVMPDNKAEGLRFPLWRKAVAGA